MAQLARSVSYFRQQIEQINMNDVRGIYDQACLQRYWPYCDIDSEVKTLPKPIRVGIYPVQDFNLDHLKNLVEKLIQIYRV